MPLVFLGDVSLPPGVGASPLSRPPPGFGCPAVANLEGPILDPAHVDAGRMGVWSGPHAADFLRAWDVRAVSLANNHSFDLGATAQDAAARLAATGIATFGAGRNLAEAGAPCLIRTPDATYALLAFGWNVIGCQPAGPRRAGVNPLRPRHVLECIERTRRAHPAAHIALMLHWDYEGEVYPQPLHRQLAFAAIEAGAGAVVGGHPHCVQGIEMHRGCPIVYSLGNWLLAWGSYWGGQLTYPDFMRRQLAFEWTPESGELRCHWYDYDPATHGLRAMGSEAPDQSAAVRELTPFAGMDAATYRAWFRAHRRKRRWLPVYDDTDTPALVACKDAFVMTRQRVIDAMVRFGLKGGPQ